MKILVIGGGAAGLAASIAAARGGASVAVADRMDRVGKKILASGNGRCNLSNKLINIGNYHGSGAEHAHGLIGRYGPDFIANFFGSIGVLTATDDNSRIYPVQYSSASVLNALRTEAARLGVAELTSHEAVSIKRSRNALIVHFNGKQAYAADRVIVAAGGKASPHLGSDGGGYKLFTEHGHRLNAPTPALVPLYLPNADIRRLKGIRVQAGASLLAVGNEAKISTPHKPRHISLTSADADTNAKINPLHGASVYYESGELLFTDYGISGIPALNISCYVAPYVKADAAAEPGSPHFACTGFDILLDLFPGYSYTELCEFILSQMIDRPHISLRATLDGLLHARVADAVMERAFGSSAKGVPHAPGSAKKSNGGVDKTYCATDDSLEIKGKVENLTRILKSWRFRLIGVAGFENAQVTYGGLSFDDFDPGTLESKLVKGLYAAGEILDVAGICGGYNLHWAWVSGHRAGTHAALPVD